MIPYLLLILLLLVTAGLAVILRQQHKIIGQLRRSRDRIIGEEDRAFRFLHGLGEALENDYGPANLHRCIVEGIISALEASGAALYQLDEKKEQLVPRFVSERCPPPIALTDEVIRERAAKPGAVSNYLRLQSVDAAHPIFRRALETRKLVEIGDMGAHAEIRPWAVADLHDGVALVIAPLIYAGRPLGLLMVARNRPGEPFGENEVEVFRSLAEQSAYALGSAELHKEAHDKRLLDADLRTASEFQRILLPSAAPDLARFDIAGVNYPAKLVSGDYYDYVSVDETHLGIVIADVSGKGVPASLIMANCRSVLRARAAGNLSPADVLRSVNSHIFADIREDMFITMAYLILDESSDTVKMARAGHDPPLVYRGESGEVEAIEPRGMALGIDSGSVFERIITDHEFSVRQGDLLLLYTDGVSEAEDDKGEEFGVERIHEVLRKDHAHTATGVISRLNGELRGFTGDGAQSDDITLIAIKKG